MQTLKLNKQVQNLNGILRNKNNEININDESQSLHNRS